MTRIRLSELGLQGPAHAMEQATLRAVAACHTTVAPDRWRFWLRQFASSWLPFAVRNQVAPMVAHALLAAEAGTDAQLEPWRQVHEGSRRRIGRLLEEMDALAYRLQGAGIRLVALKNGGIARGIYPCTACCPMGDLDLLVARERFVDAHRLMLEQGFCLASRSLVEPADLQRGLTDGGCEYVKGDGPEALWFELQWRPIAGRWIRKDQEPDGQPLLERARPLPQTAVHLLHPNDNLLQVALHTAKHSYVRAPGLRLHTDVDRIVTFTPPDWPAFVEQTRSLQVQTAVYFSLALAAALFETPIPDDVLTALAPAHWKIVVIRRWLRACGLFEPDQAKFSRPAMMLFHALLYDDSAGLAAAVLATRRSQLRLSQVPAQLRPALGRLYDLARRYQR